MKKNEKKFLLILVLFTAFFWIGSHFFSQTSSDTIIITINGETFGQYSLLEDQIISIGDTNVCEIKNGEAVMTHALCPDHLCLKQSAITRKGGTIVCLPNKIVIKGGSSASSSEYFPELDAVS